MPVNAFISDDPGTILDSVEDMGRAVPAQAGSRGAAAPADAGVPLGNVVEHPYRSPYRLSTPRIMICDDGSLDEGETIYVRDARIVIGRTHGTIVIPHDTAMSGEHAEVMRQDVGGVISWVLRDLESSNGTLVRCRSIALQSGMIIQIGSKRYRFENPRAGASQGVHNAESVSTALVEEVVPVDGHALPSLTECSVGTSSGPARMLIRSASSSIGRPGLENDIELDDPCVAPAHATLQRDSAGSWHLRAKPSINGVWVKINGIKLTNGCHFQCGEQRFRFQLGR